MSSISSEQEKDVECTEKISSVFMLVVLIDEGNFFFVQALSVFVGGLVFRRSSDFFRKRLSLCFFGRDHRNTHQDDLLGNKMIS
jgi:hypothetical protein